MKIEEVSKDDTDELIQLAKCTILESVRTDDDTKLQIISDTKDHIENNISGSERVFLKCTESTILGFILVQDYWKRQ